MKIEFGKLLFVIPLIMSNVCVYEIQWINEDLLIVLYELYL